MRRNDPKREIEDLRRFRARPPKNLSMAGELAKVREEAGKAQRAVETIGVAFEQLVPPALRDSVRPVSHVRGVLTVATTDSAARYKFDQWLRAGGLRLLQSKATRTLTRIKIV